MSLRPTSLSPLSRTLRHVLLGAGLSIGAGSLAYADSSPARVYHIAPSELETALNQFGREAGVLISYGSNVTNGLKTQGLEGSYTAEQALAHLLGGTGLQAKSDEQGGFTLQPANRSGERPYRTRRIDGGG